MQDAPVSDLHLFDLRHQSVLLRIGQALETLNGVVHDLCCYLGQDCC